MPTDQPILTEPSTPGKYTLYSPEYYLQSSQFNLLFLKMGP